MTEIIRIAVVDGATVVTISWKLIVILMVIGWCFSSSVDVRK